jgi:hypothetical protein
MREKLYPSNDEGVGYSLNSIGACYQMQNKKKMAMDYYQRALILYENCLPVGHINRVGVEHNIRQLTEQK